MNQKIGFVGIGRMGANMARNLKDKGYEISSVNDEVLLCPSIIQRGQWPFGRWQVASLGHRKLTRTIPMNTDATLQTWTQRPLQRITQP